MSEIINVEFTSLHRESWIRVISDCVNSISNPEQWASVELDFTDISSPDEIESIHLVTLACLIEFLDRKGYYVTIKNRESKIGEFLFETLQFQSYWTDRENFVPAKDDYIFNLWRIVDSEKESHSQLVHDYLQNTFFKNKDLSAVKESLVEVYYNIFDHAQSEGNAFSLIKFDENTEKLHIAVCDFGVGIATTVRNFIPEITSDAKALEKAMENGFTIRSQEHNGGRGLANILATCFDNDVLRIVSNNGFMYAQKKGILVRELDLNFNGTLIYYELSLSHFDDKEIIDNFDQY